MNGLLRFPEAIRRDPAIDAWRDRQAPDLGAVARAWFARMRKCGPDVRELMHDGCPTACIGAAPFGYVNVFTTHVNVGFFHGADLGDPAGLLEGRGRRMRHVQLRPGSEVDPGALGALIEAAYMHLRLCLEPWRT